MTDIKTLKKEAYESARWLGHRMGDFFPVHLENGQDLMRSVCARCHRVVDVTPRPMSGESEIAGDVFGATCE